MEFSEWEWDITWSEMIFLAEDEIGVEAEVWRYDQTEPALRPVWPDADEIENFRVCLFEIDGHAIAGTLDSFRADIACRIDPQKNEKRLDQNWQLEGPWIGEWVNLWRVMNGPENEHRSRATKLCERFLGLTDSPAGTAFSLGNLRRHPRLELELLQSMPRYKRPRGRPSTSVPWATQKSQSAMNDIRLRCSNGVNVAEAARQCAEDFEKNDSDDRSKDLAKLYRKKTALRGNIAEVLVGG